MVITDFYLGPIEYTAQWYSKMVKFINGMANIRKPNIYFKSLKLLITKPYPRYVKIFYFKNYKIHTIKL